MATEPPVAGADGAAAESAAEDGGAVPLEGGAAAESAAVDLEGGAVLYRAAGGLAEITLNRPEVLNAINGAVHHGVLAALERAAGDDAIRAVVIRGSGRAFSAGGDLKAVAAGEDVGHPAALGEAIWNLAKPVIAAVHGYCLGQACEVAAVCDLTVATESARFGEVEINHGWGPPLPVTPFALGLKRAKEILLLGEMFDAQFAVQIGLVNRVVSDTGLDAEVARIADRIAGLKPEAVAANKRLVNSRYERAGFAPGSR
jgi:enoyl-CoA hydratase/carnithine racemase